MFRVRATDLAGNVELAPPVHSWSIDSSTPDTVIDSGPSGTTGSQTATFAFSSPDAGSGATFDCEIDGGGLSPCSSPVTYNALPEGSHTFRVRVRDAVGNVDPTPATRTWMIDLTGPETSIVSGPSGSVSSTSASFVFSANETSTFECDLDAGGFATCPANHNLTGLGQGMHMLQVRAIDSQGNPDPTPAQRVWIVDTVNPVVSVSAPTEGSLTSGSVQLMFSVNETASTTCRLDGGSFAPCAPGASFSLATGSHVADVRAVDPAGNMGTTTRSWTVDATPPDTSVTSGPMGMVASTSATVSFTSPDASATFQCNLDGGGFSTCTSPRTVESLTQGSHTLQVRAVDVVGNVDPTPAMRSWIVDTMPPDTQIVSGPPSPSRAPNAQFDLAATETGSTYECSLDGATFASCSDPHMISVDNGSHTLQARAIDAAGNADPSPATLSWTVDLVNLVFVTSTIMSGNLGGLAGADSICQTRAQAAGLYGTYRAWLSTSTVDAISRLGAASAWTRPDGKPFANTSADIAAGRIFYPVLLDEFGDVSLGPVMTATASNGTRDSARGTCLDWTTAAPTPAANWATTGSSASGSTRFTQYVSGDGASSFVTTCDFGKVYCFGIDYTTTVEVPSPTSRQAFITAGLWAPGGGIASADALCATEAQAASLVGTFKALLPTSSQGALSRFSTTGQPWSRPDGPELSATAAQMTSVTRLSAAPNVTASGDYVLATSAGDAFWSGPWTSAGAQTCADWTSSSSGQNGATGLATDASVVSLTQSPAASCDRALRLLCLEE